MKPGIRALVALDGAPLPVEELKILGLEEWVLEGGLALRVDDVQTGAISHERTPDSLTVFAGFLDEAQHLAGTLGLASSASPASLAAAALERFGSDAPRRMLGQWTLLRWHAARRQLTLLASESLRDTNFFAFDRGRLALAPSCLLLTALPWVGRALDPVGLPLNASRGGLRHIRRDETVWKGVHMLAPATREVFTASGRETTRMTPQTSFERWSGSFDEMVEALDGVGRRVLRQHLERQGTCAFHLSGGLDSTLITTWGSLERVPGREMFAVTSVAPPGSGLPDELEWSAAAAESLGMDLRQVWPETEGDLFRPTPALLRAAEAPVFGPYLIQQALDRASLAGDATAVFSGFGGEMAISNGFSVPETRTALRIWGSRLRDRAVARRRRGGWPAAAFHVRFHPDRMATLPAAWAPVWRKGPPRANDWDYTLPKNDPPIGFSVMAAKNAGNGTGDPDSPLRHLCPFEDQRLQRLAARVPVSFLAHEGRTRPLARALLKGRVPEFVRLRKHGRPYSPDFVTRLKAQTAQAEARIPLYREAGVARWLDLDWLGSALGMVRETRSTTDYPLFYEVQATALMAEFLLWAASESVRL